MTYRSVLSVGHDGLLLHLRTAVMRASGFAVIDCCTVAEAIEKFSPGDFDAVLLCHTLKEDEQRKIENFIKSKSPSTPVIVVTKNNVIPKIGDVSVPTSPYRIIEAVTYFAKVREQRPE